VPGAPGGSPVRGVDFFCVLAKSFALRKCDERSGEAASDVGSPVNVTLVRHRHSKSPQLLPHARAETSGPVTAGELAGLR